MTETTFPVPEFSDLAVAFGAPRDSYLTREQMGDDFYSDRNHYTRTASALFFRGGSLADHDLRFKAGIDRTKAMRAIKALLCSFEPKHEVKIGTVGFALSQWTEHHVATKAPVSDHQARKQAAVARKAKGKGKAFGRAA